MLKLNNELTFDSCGCSIYVNSKTGVKSATNANGYTSIFGVVATNTDYKLTDGIAFSILYNEKGKKLNVLNNSNDFGTPLTIADIPNEMTFVPPVEEYTITQDGKTLLLTLFIMSKEFYLSRSQAWFSQDKPVMYLEAGKIVHEFKGAKLTISSKSELLAFLHTVNVDDIQGLIYQEQEFFSICNVLYCYQQMLQEQFDDILGYKDTEGKYRCPTGECNDKPHQKNNIDLLRNATTALKYLIECENYSDAEVIVNLLTQCGSVCTKYKIGKDDCGCR